MTKFQIYLDRVGLSANSFAKKHGISQGYLSETVSGKRLPSLKLAYKIFLATDRYIEMDYWFERSIQDHDAIKKLQTETNQAQGV